MRILVYDIAAEDGGGRYVLTQFYRELVEECEKSISFAEKHEWFFLTSVCTFPETEHIHVLSYPEVKQSGRNRVMFDLFRVRGILKEIRPDRIISLQNYPVVGAKVPQYVYLHQSLQYCPKRYSFFKKEERSTAFRQKVICGVYKRRLPKAAHIFVQTQWMKQATADWLRCSPDRISVIPMRMPEVPIRTEAPSAQTDEVCFFYPARPESYKNHEVVIEAVRLLCGQAVGRFRVLFTFTADENEYAKRIAAACRDLPIGLVGTVPHEQIWDCYAQYVLLFPSYMETVGLPLLEARAVGGYILASDLPFSHEDLDGYTGVRFFPYRDAAQLAEKMKQVVANGKPETTVSDACDTSADMNERSNIVLQIMDRIKLTEND